MSTPLDRLKLINHLTQNNDFQVSEGHFFDEFPSLYEAFRSIQSNESKWLKLRRLDNFIIGASLSFIVLSFAMVFASLSVPFSLPLPFFLGSFGFGCGFLLFRVVSDNFWNKVLKYISFNTPFNKKCFEERTNALNDLNQWEPQLSTEDLQLLQGNPALSKWGKEWVEKSLGKRIQLDEKKRHEELFLKFIEQPVSVSVDTDEPLASCNTQDQDSVASSPAITKI